MVSRTSDRRLPATAAISGTFLSGVRTEGSADGRDRFFIAWKTAAILLRDGLLTDPHRKLATATHNEFGFDPGLCFDERSHTGRSWPVVSNLAVTDADALHKTSCLGSIPERASTKSPSAVS
jgi:hypothetical protein